MSKQDRRKVVEQKKTTDAGAVTLDEQALDDVQGGLRSCDLVKHLAEPKEAGEAFQDPARLLKK